jgi:hypothetical protein
MQLRLRRRPVSPLEPPAETDPATRAVTLRRLIDELNGTVESLWWDARWTCTQLALARNEARADVHPCCDQPPSAHTAPLDADEPVLRRIVDELSGTAETLRSEAKWARTELAAAVIPEPRLGGGIRYG